MSPFLSNSGKRIQWKRAIAFMTASAFFLTQFQMLPAFARTAPAFPSAPAFNAHVPENLADIEDSFHGKSTHSVVLVQDAHAAADAQKNTHALIEFFQKNHGLRQVAVEGAASRMDLEIFRSFPDQKRLKKVLEQYAQRGEVTGAELAAALSPYESNYDGIEEWGLYEEALGFYLDAMSRESAAVKQISVLKKQLSEKKKSLYSSELFALDQSLEAFALNQEDFLDVLRDCLKIGKPAAGTQLELLAGHLSEADKTYTLQKETEKAALKIKILLEGRKNDAFEISKFNQQYQAFLTSSLAPDTFALFLDSFVTQNKIPFAFSGEWRRSLEDFRKIQNLEGSQIFREFESYAAELKKGLLRGPEQQELDRRGRELHLTEKLTRLSLTSEEWKEINSGNFPFLKKRESVRSAIDFYKNAGQRDNVFFRRLQKMAEKNDVLFVAGGYHTRGMTQKLREAGISYRVVRPVMQSVPEKNIYPAQMSGNVSWKNYFKVENGKIDLYKAFVRGVRDRLLEENGETGIKDWRDQIIRDLAKQGRIEKAADYTRFIDEKMGLSPQKIPKWLRKFDGFIEGFEKLDASNQFTREHILSLLKTSHVLQAAGNASAVPGSLLSSRLVLARAEMRNLWHPGEREILKEAVAKLADKIHTNPGFRTIIISPGGAKWAAKLLKNVWEALYPDDPLNWIDSEAVDFKAAVEQAPAGSKWLLLDDVISSGNSMAFFADKAGLFLNPNIEWNAAIFFTEKSEAHLIGTTGRRKVPIWFGYHSARVVRRGWPTWHLVRDIGKKTKHAFGLSDVSFSLKFGKLANEAIEERRKKWDEIKSGHAPLAHLAENFIEGRLPSEQLEDDAREARRKILKQLNEAAVPLMDQRLLEQGILAEFESMAAEIKAARSEARSNEIINAWADFYEDDQPGFANSNDTVEKIVTNRLVPRVARLAADQSRTGDVPILGLGDGNMVAARMIRTMLEPAEISPITVVEPAFAEDRVKQSKLGQLPHFSHLSKRVEDVQAGDFPAPRVVYGSFFFEYTEREKTMAALKRTAAPDAEFIFAFHARGSVIEDEIHFQRRELEIAIRFIDLQKKFGNDAIDLAEYERQVSALLSGVNQKFRPELERDDKELKDWKQSAPDIAANMVPYVLSKREPVLIDLKKKYLEYVRQYAPFHPKDGFLKEFFSEVELSAVRRQEIEAHFGTVFSSEAEILTYFNSRGFIVRSVTPVNIGEKTGFFLVEFNARSEARVDVSDRELRKWLAKGQGSLEMEPFPGVKITFTFFKVTEKDKGWDKFYVRAFYQVKRGEGFKDAKEIGYAHATITPGKAEMFASFQTQGLAAERARVKSEAIFVLPEIRRKYRGVGRAMMILLMRLSRLQGVTRMDIGDVQDEEFFKGLRFTKTRERVGVLRLKEFAIKDYSRDFSKKPLMPEIKIERRTARSELRAEPVLTGGLTTEDIKRVVLTGDETKAIVEFTDGRMIELKDAVPENSGDSNKNKVMIYKENGRVLVAKIARRELADEAIEAVRGFFQTEKQVSEKLRGKVENISSIIWEGEAGNVDRPAILIEGLELVSLGSYRGRLSFEHRIAIFKQYLQKVFQAWREGISLLDLKPENVLLEILEGPDGPVFKLHITDLEGAKFIAREMPEKRDFIFSLPYRIGDSAYEVLRNKFAQTRGQAMTRYDMLGLMSIAELLMTFYVFVLKDDQASGRPDGILEDFPEAERQRVKGAVQWMHRQMEKYRQFIFYAHNNGFDAADVFGDFEDWVDAFAVLAGKAKKHDVLPPPVPAAAPAEAREYPTWIKALMFWRWPVYFAQFAVWFYRLVKKKKEPPVLKSGMSLPDALDLFKHLHGRVSVEDFIWIGNKAPRDLAVDYLVEKFYEARDRQNPQIYADAKIAVNQFYIQLELEPDYFVNETMKYLRSAQLPARAELRQDKKTPFQAEELEFKLYSRLNRDEKRQADDHFKIPDGMVPSNVDEMRDAMIAYYQNRPIGIYQFKVNLNFSKVVMGAGIDIDEEFQGRKAGTFLRERLFRYLKDEGYRSILIYAAKTEAAIGFMDALEGKPGVTINLPTGPQALYSKSARVELLKYQFAAEARSELRSAPVLTGNLTAADIQNVHLMNEGSAIVELKDKTNIELTDSSDASQKNKIMIYRENGRVLILKTTKQGMTDKEIEEHEGAFAQEELASQALRPAVEDISRVIWRGQVDIDRPGILIEGLVLSSLLKYRERLSLEHRIQIFKQVVQKTRKALQSGVAILDLKLDNILLEIIQQPGQQPVFKVHIIDLEGTKFTSSMPSDDEVYISTLPYKPGESVFSVLAGMMKKPDSGISRKDGLGLISIAELVVFFYIFVLKDDAAHHYVDQVAKEFHEDGLLEMRRLIYRMGRELERYRQFWFYELNAGKPLYADDVFGIFENYLDEFEVIAQKAAKYDILPPPAAPVIKEPSAVKKLASLIWSWLKTKLTKAVKLLGFSWKRKQRPPPPAIERQMTVPQILELLRKAPDLFSERNFIWRQNKTPRDLAGDYLREKSFEALKEKNPGIFSQAEKDVREMYRLMKLPLDDFIYGALEYLREFPHNQPETAEQSRSEVRAAAPLRREVREKIKKIVITSETNFSRQLLALWVLLPVLRQNFPYAVIETDLPVMQAVKMEGLRSVSSESGEGLWADIERDLDSVNEVDGNLLEDDEVLVVRAGFMGQHESYIFPGTPLRFAYLVINDTKAGSYFARGGRPIARSQPENSKKNHVVQAEFLTALGLEGLGAGPWTLDKDHVSQAVLERMAELKEKEPRLDISEKGKNAGRPVVFVNLLYGILGDWRDDDEESREKWPALLLRLLKNSNVLIAINGGPEKWSEANDRTWHQPWKEIQTVHEELLKGADTEDLRDRILPVWNNDVIGLFAMALIAKETNGFGFLTHSAVTHVLDWTGTKTVVTDLNNIYVRYLLGGENLRELKPGGDILDAAAPWLNARSEVRTDEPLEMQNSAGGSGEAARMARQEAAKLIVKQLLAGKDQKPGNVYDRAHFSDLERENNPDKMLLPVVLELNRRGVGTFETHLGGRGSVTKYPAGQTFIKVNGYYLNDETVEKLKVNGYVIREFFGKYHNVFIGFERNPVSSPEETARILNQWKEIMAVIRVQGPSLLENEEPFTHPEWLAFSGLEPEKRSELRETGSVEFVPGNILDYGKNQGIEAVVFSVDSRGRTFNVASQILEALSSDLGLKPEEVYRQAGLAGFLSLPLGKKVGAVGIQNVAALGTNPRWDYVIHAVAYELVSEPPSKEQVKAVVERVLQEAAANNVRSLVMPVLVPIASGLDQAEIAGWQKEAVLEYLNGSKSEITVKIAIFDEVLYEKAKARSELRAKNDAERELKQKVRKIAPQVSVLIFDVNLMRLANLEEALNEWGKFKSIVRVSSIGDLATRVPPAPFQLVINNLNPAVEKRLLEPPLAPYRDTKNFDVYGNTVRIEARALPEIMGLWSRQWDERNEPADETLAIEPVQKKNKPKKRSELRSSEAAVKVFQNVITALDIAMKTLTPEQKNAAEDIQNKLSGIIDQIKQGAFDPWQVLESLRVLKVQLIGAYLKEDKRAVLHPQSEKFVVMALDEFLKPGISWVESQVEGSPSQLSIDRLTEIRKFMAESPHRVEGILIFGSMTRGTATFSSDMDYILLARSGDAMELTPEETAFYKALAEKFPFVSPKPPIKIILNSAPEASAMIEGTFILPFLDGDPLAKDWMIIGQSDEAGSGLENEFYDRLREIKPDYARTLPAGFRSELRGRGDIVKKFEELAAEESRKLDPSIAAKRVVRWFRDNPKEKRMPGPSQMAKMFQRSPGMKFGEAQYIKTYPEIKRQVRQEIELLAGPEVELKKRLIRALHVYENFTDWAADYIIERFAADPSLGRLPRQTEVAMEAGMVRSTANKARFTVILASVREKIAAETFPKELRRRIEAALQRAEKKSESLLHDAGVTALKASFGELVAEAELNSAAEIFAEAGPAETIEELQRLRARMQNKIPDLTKKMLQQIIFALSKLPPNGVDVAYAVPKSKNKQQVDDFVTAVKKFGVIKRVLVPSRGHIPDALTVVEKEGVRIARLNLNRKLTAFLGEQTHAGFIAASEDEAAGIKPGSPFIPVISIEMDLLEDNDTSQLVIAMQTAMAILLAHEVQGSARAELRLKPEKLLFQYGLFKGFENAVVSGDGRNIRVSGAGVRAYLEWQAMRLLSAAA